MSNPDLLASVAALAPLAFVINWLVETLKDATNQNWNGLSTRIGALVVAFGSVSAYAHSAFGNSLAIAPGTNLGTMNCAGLFLISVAVAAGGGTLADSPVTKTAVAKLFPTLAARHSGTPTPAPAVPRVDHTAEIAALQAQIDALKTP